MSFGGAFTYAWAEPTIEGTDITARTLLGTLEADYPLVRKQSYTLRGSAGMDIVNQESGSTASRPHPRPLAGGFLRLGLGRRGNAISAAGYSLAEPPWRVSALLEMRQGFTPSAPA